MQDRVDHGEIPGVSTTESAELRGAWSAGTYQITLHAANGIVPPASQHFTIVVAAPATTTPATSATSAPVATVLQLRPAPAGRHQVGPIPDRRGGMLPGGSGCDGRHRRAPQSPRSPPLTER